jgi:hypothetical protein
MWRIFLIESQDRPPRIEITVDKEEVITNNDTNVTEITFPSSVDDDDIDAAEVLAGAIQQATGVAGGLGLTCWQRIFQTVVNAVLKRTSIK